MSLTLDLFFATKAEQNRYRELVNTLQGGAYDCRIEIVSPQRQQEELIAKAKASTADVILATGTLNSSLPTVLAYNTLKPVVALPCSNPTRGLDAFLSAMQMPPGVPVLTAGVENQDTLLAFLKQLEAKRSALPHVAVRGPGTSRESDPASRPSRRWSTCL